MSDVSVAGRAVRRRRPPRAWRALAAFDRAYYRVVPAERLALLRIALGTFLVLYLALRFPSFAAVTRFHPSEFAPVGPVSLLSGPLPAAAVTALAALTLALSPAFLLGFHYRLTGPVFALLLLFLTSYRSSWGMKFHTENLFTLHALVLSLAPAADALSLDARRAPRRPTPAPHGRYGWALSVLSLVTVATYVLAGAAKLRLGAGSWLEGATLQAQVAYDNLRKIELGSLHSPFGAALVPYSWLFTGLAWFTLAVELGAPLALSGRRAALVWSAGAWSFHVGILALMAIAFPYPLSFVPYLSFLPLERALDRPFVRRALRAARLVAEPA